MLYKSDIEDLSEIILSFLPQSRIPILCQSGMINSSKFKNPRYLVHAKLRQSCILKILPLHHISGEEISVDNIQSIRVISPISS